MTARVILWLFVVLRGVMFVLAARDLAKGGFPRPRGPETASTALAVLVCVVVFLVLSLIGALA